MVKWGPMSEMGGRRTPRFVLTRLREIVPVSLKHAWTSSEIATVTAFGPFSTYLPSQRNEISPERRCYLPTRTPYPAVRPPSYLPTPSYLLCNRFISSTHAHCCLSTMVDRTIGNSNARRKRKLHEIIQSHEQVKERQRNHGRKALAVIVDG